MFDKTPTHLSEAYSAIKIKSSFYRGLEERQKEREN